jgi:ubiquinol-cytochrome c reductase cytochrome b subunit
MMATAFLGYVLPWGQMSFWGATVITNLISAIPLVGDYMVNILWGGLSVNSATLNRFFCLHFILPFIILVGSLLHVIMLHDQGVSLVHKNKALNLISFVPYCILKDFILLSTFFIMLVVLISFYPNEFLHSENYVLANELVTPPHLSVE